MIIERIDGKHSLTTLLLYSISQHLALFSLHCQVVGSTDEQTSRNILLGDEVDGRHGSERFRIELIKISDALSILRLCRNLSLLQIVDSRIAHQQFGLRLHGTHSCQMSSR